MSKKSTISVSYESPEQAAAIAEMLARNYSETGVRAVQNGRTVDIVPDNSFLVDVVGFISTALLRVVQSLRNSSSIGDTTSRA